MLVNQQKGIEMVFALIVQKHWRTMNSDQRNMTHYTGFYLFGVIPLFVHVTYDYAKIA